MFWRDPYLVVYIMEGPYFFEKIKFRQIYRGVQMFLRGSKFYSKISSGGSIFFKKLVSWGTNFGRSIFAMTGITDLQ